MERDVIQEAASQPAAIPSGAVAPSQGTAGSALSQGAGSCPSCGSRNLNSAANFVYALGRVEPRFPRLSVEKEFAQATGRAETAGLTDREALHRVLSRRENRYLVKQLCWLLMVEGMEAYFLQPRDSSDFDLLIDALRPSPRMAEIDVVIGVRGPIVPPEYCNGVTAPMVLFSQIYSFDMDSFVKAIPRPEGIAEHEFPKAAEELFLRVLQMANNSGATDEHRALNYIVLRYPAIYARTAEEFGRDFSLTGVEVRPSALANPRKIADVVFSYTNRKTDFTEKFFLRVDVTEEFPFLVSKLSPYYDR